MQERQRRGSAQGCRCLLTVMGRQRRLGTARRLWCIANRFCLQRSDAVCRMCHETARRRQHRSMHRACHALTALAWCSACVHLRCCTMLVLLVDGIAADALHARCTEVHAWSWHVAPIYTSFLSVWHVAPIYMQAYTRTVTSNTTFFICDLIRCLDERPACTLHLMLAPSCRTQC